MGWTTCKLKDVCNPVKVSYRGNGLPYVGLENIESNTGRYLSKEGIIDVKSNTFHFLPDYILYGRLRPYLNKVLLPDFEGHCSTEIFPLAVGNNVDRKFLYYWLINPQTVERINDTSTGARMPRANFNQVINFSFSFPQLPEQRRIVEILDEAFEAIDAAITNTEKSLANTRELFESYLNSAFSSIEDWRDMRLGDKNLLQIIDGDRGKNYPTKEDFLSEGFCLFLNTKNVRPDGFNFDETMFITKEKDGLLNKGKLNRRDVLLTTRGTIGNIAIYNVEVKFDHVRINSGMLIFRPNEDVITSEYLFEILRSGLMKQQMRQFVSGAAQPQLPIKTLVNFSLPVPKDINVQKKIVLKLSILSGETRKLEIIYQEKLDYLSKLKQSLLQKAFRGELTSSSDALAEVAA